MKKIKVLELFGGISAPHKALVNLGFDVETVDYVEFDPKIVEIRNIMYNTTFSPQSVVGYSYSAPVDILIGGSPCQDFSTAGLGAGGEENSGTRSSLIWEQMRILKETMPKYYIWENVKAVLFKKHKPIFEKHNAFVENLGYTLHYKVLNAKDFGIPQNRERVFVVAIRNDIANTFSFDNLQTKPMKPLKDFLEMPQDSWYFVKQKQKWVEDRLLGIDRGGAQSTKPQNLKCLDSGEQDTYTNTIITEQWKGNNQGMIVVPIENTTNLEINEFTQRMLNTVVKPESESTIGTICANNRLNSRGDKSLVLEIENGKLQGYSNFNSENYIITNENCAKTITSTGALSRQKLIAPLIDKKDSLLVVNYKDTLYNVRIITEWEAFALMGFEKEYVDTLKNNGVSRANTYKVAGNSIVVDVLEAIFSELLKDYDNS